ncbi:aldose 1-epimerase family protein [Vallitalea okinawensis]|uniref:aldose 1-epimerase family protein n=1 Tax=Vallitalea okinawensis TaxID=2078660 RepID=UPI000CFB660F|nr:aldose 1-epimerase family protein [Vallitalea okinawensis]
MIHTIQNEYISISVKNHGAELCSLKSIEENKEYLWQADPQYWGKHAPILFPIVGCLKDNKYNKDNETYEMGRHGFARDMDFQLVEKKEDALKYRLLYSELTLKKYPYLFELFVTYRINDKELDISYEVVNKGDKGMYFSIGAHPAFNCNISEGDKYLEFEKNETLQSYIINTESGLREEGKRLIVTNSKRLPLHDDLFTHDALIFDSLELNSITICDENREDKVKISFEGFPYVGIWTPNAQFICIEPWYGIADAIDSTNRLEDKKGIQYLDVSKTFKCNYKIEILK